MVESSYEIGQKYGYSAEEILSSAFYATRKEVFFEFYRTEMLAAAAIAPGRGFLNLQKMEEIRPRTLRDYKKRLFGLLERAGCRNVINLHGSIYDNFCPHCGEKISD